MVTNIRTSRDLIVMVVTVALLLVRNMCVYMYSSSLFRALDSIVQLWALHEFNTLESADFCVDSEFEVKHARFWQLQAPSR